ncbi:hypothetical protein BD310DRAFT_909245 [Dichomitus squalens]|uniref:Uncharacterized protein n=1 Tax=Dichomitus squalens TaxID=114155 RepID=A0A4Q9PFP1_9APHY|nr:hypothetical protein BD310DRAFT_909245 [Dichomitus squalens]
MGGLPLRSPTHILMVFLSSLYGILVHQVYRYAGMYPSDLVVAEITVYATVFVPPVGKQTHLAELRVSRILETAHMAVSCQTWFLARRVYMFEARYRIWVMIAGFVSVRMFRALSIWSTGILTEATIASTIVDLQYTTNGFAACIPKTWFEACAAGLALCADIILTTVLILALHRSRIGVKW